jgi:hypothetical protein
MKQKTVKIMLKHLSRPEKSTCTFCGVGILQYSDNIIHFGENDEKYFVYRCLNCCNITKFVEKI